MNKKIFKLKHFSILFLNFEKFLSHNFEPFRSAIETFLECGA